MQPITFFFYHPRILYTLCFLACLPVCLPACLLLGFLLAHQSHHYFVLQVANPSLCCAFRSTKMPNSMLRHAPSLPTSILCNCRHLRLHTGLMCVRRMAGRTWLEFSAMAALDNLPKRFKVPPKRSWTVSREVRR